MSEIGGYHFSRNHTYTDKNKHADSGARWCPKKYVRAVHRGRVSVETCFQ
jgi:hypothetical protein